jgi:hypothetical protein
MQDSQDNTFPIPASGDNTNNQAGSVNPAATDSSGLGFNPAPPPDATQQPVAPDWTNQATADAAQLPPGVDDYSINTATQPNVASPTGLPLSPAPAPDPSAIQTPSLNTDAGIPPTPIPPDPSMDPIQAYQPPTTPVQTDPSVYPQQPMDQAGMQAQPTYDPNAMQSVPAVPQANTLDLSNQPMGTMQPGVEIAPQMGVQDGTMPLDTGGIPPDFGSSYNTEATDMMGAQTGKSRLPMKFILIGAGALAFIIIISLILVFVNRNQRTPAVDLNQAVVEETQKPEEDTKPAEIPEGYKKVERDCFTFGVLLPTTVNFTPTTCKISAKFGSVSQYNLTITAVTDPVTDLQGLVDQAKVGTITTQEDIKLNGVDAKKIIQKVNGVDQQNIVVIPANKNYQLEGKAINGFIITTSFSDDTSKTASDNLVLTWTWK